MGTGILFSVKRKEWGVRINELISRMWAIEKTGFNIFLCRRCCSPILMNGLVYPEKHSLRSPLVATSPLPNATPLNLSDWIWSIRYPFGRREKEVTQETMFPFRMNVDPKTHILSEKKGRLRSGSGLPLQQFGASPSDRTHKVDFPTWNEILSA